MAGGNYSSSTPAASADSDITTRPKAAETFQRAMEETERSEQAGMVVADDEGDVSGTRPGADETNAKRTDEESEPKSLYDEIEDARDKYLSLPNLCEPEHGYLDDCVCRDPVFRDVEFEEFRKIFRDDFIARWGEESMRRYHEGLQEHTCYSAFDSFESSYRGDGHWNFRKHRAVIDYDRRTATELKALVCGRGLPDPYPAGVTLKYFYLRALDKADQNWTFRFMDLPPELRIHICRMLFSIGFVKERAEGEYDPLAEWTREVASSPAQRMDVAILRTCRHIYREAKDLLYSEFVPSMFFMVQAWDIGRLMKEIRVHRTTHNSFDDHGRYYCLPQALDDYPGYLRHVHRLELQLRYEFIFLYRDRVLPSDGWLPINQFLIGLASFLAEGHSLKYLTVKIELPARTQHIAPMTEAAIEKCLYPLRRIRNVPNVAIQGQVPEYIITKLKSDISSSKPVFNTMRYWKLLQGQASAHLELYNQISDPDCDPAEWPMPNACEELKIMLSRLYDDKTEACTSRHLERRFIAQLNRLKQTLQELDVGRMQETLQQITESRRKLAVSDHGCVEEAGELWSNLSDGTDEDSEHDGTSDEENQIEQESTIESAAHERQLLDDGENAALMQQSESDAASQLSRASTIAESYGVAEPSA